MKESSDKQLRYHSFGRDYFWLYGQYQLVIELYNKYRTVSSPRILDMGCGPGNLAFDGNTASLPNARIIGLDYSHKALLLGRKSVASSAVSFVCGDALRIPFHESAFDLVVAAEVLEHLDDDIGALRQIGDALCDNGIAIVTVPAYQWLWGHHDVWNGHKKRYSEKVFRKAVEKSGLRIVHLSFYKMAWVVPLFIMRKVKNSVGGSSESDDFIRIPKFVNTILSKLMGFEARIAAKRKIPFGCSIAAILQKGKH